MITQLTEKPEVISGLAIRFSEQSGIEYNDAVFNNIMKFIKAGVGVLFVATDKDMPIGAIMGIKYPDFFTGELTASELFWFVHEEYRGVGLKLLLAFERWAKDQGCKKIIMMHLASLMPDRVKKIYEKRGYSCIETHYSKEM